MSVGQMVAKLLAAGPNSTTTYNGQYKIFFDEKRKHFVKSVDETLIEDIYVKDLSEDGISYQISSLEISANDVVLKLNDNGVTVTIPLDPDKFDF